MIGFFYGVFIIDVVHSAQLVAKLKRFAEENGVVVRYERLKERIRAEQVREREKYRFFQPFKTSRELGEYLREMRGELESRVRRRK